MHTIELTLTTATGNLGATLDVPSCDPPWPFVLLLAGSGPTDRNGNNPLAGVDIDNLRQIGEGLAQNGIATVRPDKRGIGASRDAAPPEHEMTLDVLINDAVAWLLHIDGDDRRRNTYIAGHSEGALIATIAARHHRTRGCITLAGAGRPAAQILREQLHAQLTGSLRDTADTIIDTLEHGGRIDQPPEELAALFRPSVQPYLASWLSRDPATELQRLENPALVIHGTDDRQIPVTDARLLAGHRREVRLLEITEADHLLHGPGGLTVDPRVVAAITDFISTT